MADLPPAVGEGASKPRPHTDLDGLDRAQLLRLVEEGRQAQAKLEQIGIDLVARTLEAEAAIAAKTRFLSSITHELRTPLHTILGYVRLVIGECEGETRRQLEIVERSGNQLLKLINDLLEYNTVDRLADAVSPEPMSVEGLINQLRQTCEQYAASANANFTLSVASSVPAEVEADEGRLFQVLDNLASNACKYSRDGRVKLSIDSGPVPSEATNAGKFLCRLYFSVQDSGIGIPPNELHAIFMPFGRATNVHGYPGMGLGLAIARQWVEAMGGKLEVESELGQGSRFYFSIDVPVIGAGNDIATGASRRQPVESLPPLTAMRSAGVTRRNVHNASSGAAGSSPGEAVSGRQQTLNAKLSRDHLAQLREMVDLGRVIRLAHWADTLATQPGANRTLLANIARLAREADLLALKRLVTDIASVST